MKIIKNFVFGAFAITISVVAPVAESIGVLCNKTVVYYGNGILSTPIDNKKAKRKIEKRLKKALFKEEFDQLEFKLSPNTTNGKTRDLWESLVQSLFSNTSRFYRILSGLEPMPIWFKTAAENVAKRVDKTILLKSQNLRKHIADYEADIASGKNVIVVAHSQGNFFANEAYNLIDNSLLYRFRIVSVANPDSFVGGGYAHTTLVEDNVIGAIFALKIATAQLPVPMLPNISNTSFNPLVLNHSFTGAYMKSGTPSNSKITQDIIDALGNFSIATSCIKITEATCVRVDVDTDKWILKGIAATDQTNVLITASPSPSFGYSYSGPPLSTCIGWNGTVTQNIFGANSTVIGGFTFCARTDANDSSFTNWTAVREAYNRDSSHYHSNPPQFEFVANIWDATNINNQSLGLKLLARDSFPHNLTCPGTYTFPLPSP